jgi:hypothetical protein
VRRAVFGIEPDRLAVVGDRAVVLFLVVVRVAAAVIGQGVLGIEPDRHAVLADGAVVVALVAVYVATAVIGGSVFGIEPDCLVVFGHGPVVVAVGAVHVAAAVIGVGVLRIEPDRLVVIRKGAVVVVLGAVPVAAIVEGDREVFLGLLPGLNDARAAADLQVGRGLLLVHAPRPRLRQLCARGAARKNAGSDKSPDDNHAIDCRPA